MIATKRRQNLSLLEQLFYKFFKRLILKLVRKKKRDFDRVLSLGDYFVSRWEKAAQLGFGKETSIYDSAIVLGDVAVGEHTWIGPFTVLDGSGGLVIGDYCSISAGVQIYSHDSVDWAVSKGKNAYTYNKTVIGSGVYIGPNTVISKGITIGDHVIIGANSFVNRDIPSHSKAYGTPVKVIAQEEIT